MITKPVQQSQTLDVNVTPRLRQTDSGDQLQKLVKEDWNCQVHDDHGKRNREGKWARNSYENEGYKRRAVVSKPRIAWGPPVLEERQLDNWSLRRTTRHCWRRHHGF